MTPRPAGFEWDHGNTQKCAKHDVSRAELESVFRGEVAVHPDPAHSTEEVRFKAIGKGASGRWIFVVFTFRGDPDGPLIRPISARYMHAREVRRYVDAHQRQTTS